MPRPLSLTQESLIRNNREVGSRPLVAVIEPNTGMVSVTSVLFHPSTIYQLVIAQTGLLDHVYNVSTFVMKLEWTAIS